MISIERFRQNLPPNSALSDAEVEQLREQLYALADIVLTVYLESNSETALQVGSPERQA